MKPLIKLILYPPWMAVAQPLAALPSVFPALPEEPEPAQVTDFLCQLTQAIEQIECSVSEADLQAFIYWALRQSYSVYFTQDESLQLLDLAWKAQKLLWATRSSWLVRKVH